MSWESTSVQTAIVGILVFFTTDGGCFKYTSIYNEEIPFSRTRFLPAKHVFDVPGVPFTKKDLFRWDMNARLAGTAENPLPTQSNNKGVLNERKPYYPYPYPYPYYPPRPKSYLLKSELESKFPVIGQIGKFVVSKLKDEKRTKLALKAKKIGAVTAMQNPIVKVSVTTTKDINEYRHDQGESTLTKGLGSKANVSFSENENKNEYSHDSGKQEASAAVASKSTAGHITITKPLDLEHIFEQAVMKADVKSRKIAALAETIKALRTTNTPIIQPQTPQPETHPVGFSCPTGYRLNPDGKSCTDINECNKNNAGCEYRCHNTLGSFRCDCPPGFKLATNSLTCEDVNECFDQNSRGPCEDTCENLHGSYRCSCTKAPNTKLALDRHNCVRQGYCYGNRRCSHGCVTIFKITFCTCPDGWDLGIDGITCTVRHT